MKNKKLTTYQMAVTALMAAALCVLGPLSVPIGAIPISLSNFVICLTAWLLGPKFGTLSVAVYLLIGLVGVPVFSGYGAGIAKLAGPTGGYLVGYLLLAFIGGLFIEKSKGQPVISGIGLVLGDAACYVLGTAWFVFQMQCELGYALSVCVYPFIALDLAKIVVSCVVGALLRKRLVQAGRKPNRQSKRETANTASLFYL
jgi:biotin transport system substrate-specific component